MSTPTAQSWILLLSLGVVWGASFLGVAIALEGFSPLWVAAARIGLGAIAIGLIAWASGVRLPDRSTPTGRRIWLHAFGMAVLTNAAPFTLLSWGQTYVTSGFAGITMAGVPLLVLPLAAIFVPGETLTPRRVLGFMIGFAGVVWLIGPETILGGAEEEGPIALARMACLAATACYAFGGIITRLAPPGPLLSFSAAALLIATAIMIPLALLVDGVPAAPGLNAALAVLYLGLFPTALATLVLVQVIKTAGPSFLSLVNYQVPVWALVIGAVVLSEPVPPQTLGALGLILAGLFVAQARRGTARV